MKAAALAAGAMLIASACSSTTDCEYVERAPTGELSQDILGCWQGFGAFSLIVFQFLPDQTFRYIEPPNGVAGGGLRTSGAWFLNGDILTFGGDDTKIEVTETSLRLLDFQTSLRRGVCTGFGFEDGKAPSCQP